LDFDAPPEYEMVAAMSIRGDVLQTWQEVVEREIEINGLSLCSLVGHSHPAEFTFAGCDQIEPLIEADRSIVGMILRRQEPVNGWIDVFVESVSSGLVRLSVEVRNETPLEDGAECDREALMLRSLASTHTILELTDGKFVSLLETPPEYATAAAQCNNLGCWPVLIGQPGDQSTMLSSPIILYDYPQIAAESDGDFFDGCEIDEMLALRVMTLTDDEKQQMRGVDDRARAILERTDSRPEEYLMKLHGSMRRPVE
jgi:hydrogenase maturation protease